MMPRIGCNAVARMFRWVVPSEIEIEVEYELSSEEAHTCFHPPIRATIIADKIMHRMCTMMRQDPLQDAIILRDKVLSEDLLTLPEDDQRLVEKELPLRPEATINKIKNEALGCIPKTREDFDPVAILKMAHSIGGDKILILDSNNEDDLPPDWRNIDMKTLFEDPPSDSLVSSVCSSTGSGAGVDIACADLNDDVFTAPAPASRNTSASSAASVGRMSRPASTPASTTDSFACASRPTSASAAPAPVTSTTAPASRATSDSAAPASSSTTASSWASRPGPGRKSHCRDRC